MSPTNYSETQQDEIEALRSIYTDDFVEEDVKTGAWKKILDRTFKIKLRPANGNDEWGITLSVSLPAIYPKVVPGLKLGFGKNVRQRSRVEAEDILRTKPKSLLGIEMIYEITSSLQDILDTNEGVIPREIPNLDEERAASDAADRLAAQKVEQERRLQELKTQEEEERLLQELVKQRATRHERREKKLVNPLSNVFADGDSPGVLIFERPSSSTKALDGRNITIQSIRSKVKYRQGPVCQVFTVQPTGAIEGEDTIENKPFLVLKECNIAASNGNEPAMKQAIQKLESKMEILTGLKSHQSVIRPLNFSIRRSLRCQTPSPSSWTISILMELAGRSSLRDTLDVVDKLDVKTIRAWSIRLIEGLQHYHRHGSAHGSVHMGNILLEKGETENGTVAKLSDGGFQHDLHKLKSGRIPQRWPIAWSAPETLNKTEAQDVLPATDIWDFGLCFLQMAFGLSVLNEYQSPNSIFEELTFTKSLNAMLRQIFNNDSKKRPSAWDLLHFEFFRNDDALLETAPLDHSIFEGSVLNLAGSQRLQARRGSHAALSSRYNKDFVEEGRLGRGGFGEVFRTRNKIDGQLYAIKKIKAGSRSALDPVLSEVTVLSRLNHPNVVRYFAAWIEDNVVQDRNNSKSSGDDDSSMVMNGGRRPILPSSSRGLDFISSDNVDVVFADNEDEEGSSADEDDNYGSSDSQEGAVRSSADHEESVRAEGLSRSQLGIVLYIQMEYCKPETLRDLINCGLQGNATECWRLFRQIVQGLAHIHALSIVHRDLKPENIFIDNNGDVRIGDFGLARPGDYRTVSGTKPSKEIFGSFTKDVGTASYVAPEVRSAGNGKYNEKADMYSLGIILLEMNVSFATSMERAEILEQVHKDEHTLPTGLNPPWKETQAKMFLSLIRQKSSARPSSSDLLNSGQIPVQDEDESFRVARRLVTDQSSHYRSQFISSLFAKPHTTDGLSKPPETTAADPMQTVTLLEDVRAMSRSVPNDLDLQAIVKEKMTSVFRLHGAVERADSPALFPYNALYPSEDVVQFLTPTGKIMQLPYDLILPNAMLLARQSRPEQKTFIFDNVYRVDPDRSQPRIFGESNFDIVSGDSLNLAIHEAEVLKAMDQILEAFPNLSSVRMCYHINHSHILDAILKFCGIESSKWSAVKETISKLHTGDWTWAKVRYELRGPSIAIAATSLDELERFDFRDTWGKAVSELRSLLKDTVDLEAAFAHLQAVTLYLVRLGVRRKVYVNPLSSYNEKFYRGNMLFQCLYDQKRRSVLAAGGRYDQLVRGLQPATLKRNRVYAVGFQLAWTGLCVDMTHWLKKGARSKGKKKPQQGVNSDWKTRRCDVLIDSFDQSILESNGMDILQELWSKNISAELAERSSGNVADNAYSKSENRTDSHSWVVMIKSEDLVKIRSTSRKDETEVRKSDIASHLGSEIRERDRLEARTPKASMSHQTSQHDTNGPERDVDIQVLMSEKKGKKVNRKIVVEEAQFHKHEYLQSRADSPIVAIETKGEIFDGIIDTRLSDPESWKRFIQNAPPDERHYLGQLQNLLRTMSKEGEGGNSTAIVYNFRTKACISYNLGSVI